MIYVFEASVLSPEMNHLAGDLCARGSIVLFWSDQSEDHRQQFTKRLQENVHSTIPSSCILMRPPKNDSSFSELFGEWAAGWEHLPPSTILYFIGDPAVARLFDESPIRVLVSSQEY